MLPTPSLVSFAPNLTRPGAALRLGYRALPKPARTALLPVAWRIAAALRPADPRLADADPRCVTIVGLFSSPCGLGEGARLQADAMQARGITVERIDLAAELDPDHVELPVPYNQVLGAGPIIIHLNPPVFERALVLLGRPRLRRRKLIAYWAWELETIPPAWRQAAERVDEIWTPSHFVAAAVRAMLPTPVRVVPHPVRHPAATADRARFGLEEAECAVLVFANLNSNYARKNPLAAIEAFRRAFQGTRHGACLYLKLAGATNFPALAARVRRAGLAASQRLILCEDPLTAEARDALIASCDTLLSLHRSEGFGLTLAEAMAAGRPVIATGWSGNTDFMTQGNSTLVAARLVQVQDAAGFYDRRLRWAEADIDDAAEALRHIAAGGQHPTPDLAPELAARFTRSILASPDFATICQSDTAPA